MAWTGPAQAARFVTRTYTREEECVTNALKLLNWPILEKKRQVVKLIPLIYKCRYWYPLLCTSSVFPQNQSISSTEIYPTSAILWHVQIRTASGRELSIIDCNNLPSDYLTLDSTAKFKATISDYIFSVWCLPLSIYCIFIFMFPSSSALVFS